MPIQQKKQDSQNINSVQFGRQNISNFFAEPRPFTEDLKQGLKNLVNGLADAGEFLPTLTPEHIGKRFTDAIAGTDMAEMEQQKLAEASQNIREWAEINIPVEPEDPTSPLARPPQTFGEAIQPRRMAKALAENLPLMGTFALTTMANPIAGSALMLGIEGGQTRRMIEEVEEETGKQVDPLVKDTVPILVGSFNAALEFTGLNKILKPARVPGIRGKLYKAVVASMTEGSTEGLQEVNQLLAEAGVRERVPEDGLNRLAEATYAGSVLGLVGGAATPNRVGEIVERTAHDPTINQEEMNTALDDLEQELAAVSVPGEQQIDDEVAQDIVANQSAEEELRGLGIIPNTAVKVVEPTEQVQEADVSFRKRFPVQAAEEAGLLGQIRDVSDTAQRRRARERTGKARKIKITDKAVVKDEGNKTQQFAKEVAEIGKVEEVKDEVSRSEKETVDINVPLEISEGIQNKAVSKIKSAIGFLETRFPRLINSVDKVFVMNEDEFGRLVRGEQGASAMFDFFPDGTTGIMLKASGNVNIPQVDKIESSPQLQGTPSIERTISPKNIKANNVEIRDWVGILAHEFRHSLDFQRLGMERFLAIQELGKISTPQEIESRAQRIQERGLRPQRYLAKLSERRARAQARTAIRAYNQALGLVKKGPC